MLNEHMPYLYMSNTVTRVEHVVTYVLTLVLFLSGTGKVLWLIRPIRSIIAGYSLCRVQ